MKIDNTIKKLDAPKAWGNAIDGKLCSWTISCPFPGCAPVRILHEKDFRKLLKAARKS